MLFLKAFVVGGLICVVGQLLIDLTKLTPAKIATLPLTGFGSALASGTREAIREKGFLGVVTGPLCASAGGITVALLSALVVSLVTKPKDK